MNDMIKIHPTAIVSKNAKIGKRTCIWQNCTIMEDTVIGDDCNLGANVFIERGVKLGNRVKVKNNIALYTGVECEDDVFLGPNCVFTNVINPRSFINRKNEFKKTIVKRGATIGANATVICGNTIGEYAMIGAGAVVTKNVERYAKVLGVPAIKKGYVCKCGEALSLKRNGDYTCISCGNEYSLREDGLSVIKEI